MSEALANMPKDKLVRIAAGARSAVRKVQESQEEMLAGVLTTAGGAGAGVLAAKWPSIRGSFIDGAMVGAAVAYAAGISGAAGARKSEAFELGRGLLAGAAAIKTHDAWKRRMAAGK